MKAFARTFRAVGLAASAALLAAACASENRLERVDFSFESAPPDHAVVGAAVTLRAGQAVAVRAHPVMSEEPLEGDDRFELRSSDGSILGVDEGDEPYLFVLYGAEPGEADVRPFINGRPGPAIAARVLPAP